MGKKLLYSFLPAGVVFFGSLSTILSLMYLLNSLILITKNFKSSDIIATLFNINYLIIELVLAFYATYIIFILYYALKFRKEKETGEIYPMVKETFPTATIVLPIRGISPSLVEDSVKNLQNQSYPSEKYEILLATNNPMDEMLLSYRQIGDKNNVRIIERDSIAIGFKAGVMNQALQEIESKYVIIHDADHVPKPYLIEKLVRAFESLPPEEFHQTAFIQAKSTFTCSSELYQKSISLLRAQVFEVYYRAKHMWKGSLFNGFTCCFRTDILKEIGGFPLETLTENNGVSINLLLEGYNGRFYPELLSIGDTPRGLNSQLAQLWRWNNGTASLMRNNFWRIISSTKLSYIQKYDLVLYLLSPIILIVVGILLPSSLFLSLISNIKFTRPEIPVIGSLLLLIPGIFLVAETIVTFTSVTFENSNYKKIVRMKHIIFSYFLSLTIPLFIATATLRGLFKPKNALNPITKWNIEYKLNILLCYQIILLLINGIILIKILTISNNTIFLYLSFVLSYLVGILLSIFANLSSR